MKAAEQKTFDNIGSRARITKARDEVGHIQRRIRKLDADLVGELTARVREVDAALLHLREYAEMLVTVRGIRGDE